MHIFGRCTDISKMGQQLPCQIKRNLFSPALLGDSAFDIFDVEKFASIVLVVKISYNRQYCNGGFRHILSHCIQGHFSVNHVCRIHQYLLGDLYPVASHFHREYMMKGNTRFLAHGKSSAN